MTTDFLLFVRPRAPEEKAPFLAPTGAVIALRCRSFLAAISRGRHVYWALYCRRSDRHVMTESCTRRVYIPPSKYKHRFVIGFLYGEPSGMTLARRLVSFQFTRPVYVTARWTQQKFPIDKAACSVYNKRTADWSEQDYVISFSQSRRENLHIVTMYLSAFATTF